LSQIKLVWKSVQIEKKLRTLLDTIERTGKETSEDKLRLHAKLERWKQQIEEMQEGLSYINKSLTPKLEKILSLKVKNRELIKVAMFQPSTKNLFLELETHYRNLGTSPLGNRSFADLIALSEVAQVIALIGDAAIDMGVLYKLWRPDPSDVGHLTQEKSRIVSNEHMAELCDRWGLYEHRIHFDIGTQSQAEIEHDKGTLVEAIFGIIQIEHGFTSVLRNIQHLR
jgi:dsRNA-specific ribonuclease